MNVLMANDSSCMSSTMCSRGTTTTATCKSAINISAAVIAIAKVAGVQL